MSNKKITKVSSDKASNNGSSELWKPTADNNQRQ